MHAEYNDVPAWRYVDAPNFFGAANKDTTYEVASRRVGTTTELEEVLGDERFANGRGLKLIDVVLAPDDVPEVAKPGLRRASQSLGAL